MAQTTPENGLDHAATGQPQILLQKIYIKDSSFEAPHTPEVFRRMAAGEQPQVQLNINQQSTQLEDGVHEVVLTLTVTCTLEKTSVYLVEVHQAGIFTVHGFGADDMQTILGSYCPNLLFPYARQTISAMISNGGFPPFLLQPINFDALFAEQQRRNAPQAKGQPKLDS